MELLESSGVVTPLVKVYELLVLLEYYAESPKGLEKSKDVVIGLRALSGVTGVLNILDDKSADATVLISGNLLKELGKVLANIDEQHLRNMHLRLMRTKSRRGL